MSVTLHPIGVIHTPYHDLAPYVNYNNAGGDFYISINKEFSDGLYRLSELNYIYILFHFDRSRKKPHLRVFPPRGGGKEVGLFATRSPNRFNPIGLTVARIKKVTGNLIYTSGLDILDGTPLLDIKPYVRDFDMKPDANLGWIDEDAKPPENWQELKT
ncbi:MAG: tRNA (N6-threonylcarbamoyladenosine(37)-N6)-methyltransferase TrmO [Bacteroidales bacterium]|nr:tRNA (N6-threonylcarbamoyladenosine(37)-N6)-methyltransferase TrmO [Bacteroidales bacterium]